MKAAGSSLSAIDGRLSAFASGSWGLAEVAGRGAGSQNPLTHPAGRTPMVLNNNWIKVGALMGALAVVLGAFGAHGLEPHLTSLYAGESREVFGEALPAAAKYARDFKTAAHYHLVHSLAVVLVGVLMALRPRRLLSVAAWCFTLGVAVFSGSLYLLVISGQRWLGAVTPIGGVLLIAGWLCLVEGACPHNNAAPRDD